MTIDKKVFAEQKRPRFGNANPERMQIAFWEWMIRAGASAGGPNLAVGDESSLRSDLEAKRNWFLALGCAKVLQNGIESVRRSKWTLQRYGATQRNCRMWRIVRIGGEHEDSYDPDFWIYNDVVVFRQNGHVEIYGYPEEGFRPTDFHTATRIGEQIFIIGGLDYETARHPGHTRVYVLDTAAFQMSELKTSGEMPGWIYEHEAELQADGTIRIRNGICFEMRDGHQSYKRNIEEYSLNVQTSSWKRETKRNWSQITFRQEDGGLFALDRAIRPTDLIPRDIEFEKIAYNHARFLLGTASVQLIVSVSQKKSSSRVSCRNRKKWNWRTLLRRMWKRSPNASAWWISEQTTRQVKYLQSQIG